MLAGYNIFHSKTGTFSNVNSTIKYYQTQYIIGDVVKMFLDSEDYNKNQLLDIKRKSESVDVL